MNDGAVINIIGAGLSGLSAAKTFAENGRHVRLISVQPSERAQSNLAEGGINGALNVMGEDDSVQEHFEDTCAGGVYLADPEMVRGLTEAAPGIIYEMERLGVPFHRENGHIIERNFGGQKKKRTAYAMSSTGKVLTVALIDCVRRYEAEGLVERYSHHRFERVIRGQVTDGNTGCLGVSVCDINARRSLAFSGPVLMACGGLNGFFTGSTTGTTANTGTAAAQLFVQGVRIGNPEFLQYHPTTVAITGKRMLISEAARGEGGRLFCEKNGQRCYFMEEKYGPAGNLMPRDVVSREMALLGDRVCLDLTGLAESVWKNRLPDLRREIIHYLGTDPALEPVPVSPGIHYFMGGILVNRKHQTSLPALYASGECACAYHGANRLGGNSLLGAIYGGRTAAEAMLEDPLCQDGRQSPEIREADVPYTFTTEAEDPFEQQMRKLLTDGLGVLRDEDSLNKAIKALSELNREAEDREGYVSDELYARMKLAEAMLKAALARKESRGAHTRTDWPQTEERFRKTTAADLENGAVKISFIDIPEGRDLK